MLCLSVSDGSVGAAAGGGGGGEIVRRCLATLNRLADFNCDYDDDQSLAGAHGHFA